MAVRRNVILWAGRINAYVATVLDYGSHVVIEQYRHVRTEVIDLLPSTVAGRIDDKIIRLSYPQYRHPVVLPIRDAD
jgi:hypothetical protein